MRYRMTVWNGRQLRSQPARRTPAYKGQLLILDNEEINCPCLGTYPPIIMKALLPCLTLLTLPLLAEPLWTDPAAAARENPDFLIQGEYHKEGAAYGVQVVALGDQKFDGYLLEGGLPGVGWEPGKERIKLTSTETKGGIVLSVMGKDLPLVRLKDDAIRVHLESGKELILPRIERKSPTLGAKPPTGAVVLFDGSSADGWKNGVMEDGLLKANHSMSKQTFKNFSAHIEFRTPFKPHARGQKRGNSGIYHCGRWETQILDSFGLEGNQNETGGIYSIAKPRLNMCLPPLSWQTYDVDFTAATFDEHGKRLTWPRITVRLNGVMIQEDQELGKDFTTAAPIKTPLTDEGGPIFLQDHKNPVYFRNIWVLPK